MRNAWWFRSTTRVVMLLTSAACSIVSAQSIPDLIKSGDIAFQQKDYVKASLCYETVVAKSPEISFNVYMSLGESYEKLGNPNLALSLYKSNLDRIPERTFGRLMRKELDGSDRSQQALKILHVLKSKYPNNLRLFFCEENLRDTSGQYTEWLSAIIRGDFRYEKDAVNSWISVAKYNIAKDDFTRLENTLRTIFDIVSPMSPLPPKAFVDLSFFSLKMIEEMHKRNNHKTAEWFGEQIGLRVPGPMDPSTMLPEEDMNRLFSTMKTLLAAGHYQTVKRMLAFAAPQLKKSNATVQDITFQLSRDLSIHFITAKDYTDAELTMPFMKLSDVYQMIPDLTTKFISAKSYDDADRTIRFLKFTRKPSLDMAMMEFYFDNAQRYSKGDSLDQAVFCYQSAFRLKPDSIDLNLTIGKLFYRKKDFPTAARFARTALEYYQKINAATPGAADSYLKTGLSYLILNDLTNAEGEFQKHKNRANPTEQEVAVRQLNEFIAENVNKPDAEYLAKKYYAASLREEIVAAANRDRDNIPPKLLIISPEPTRGMKTIETISYSIPVIGFAMDDKGVGAVYVNGMEAKLSQPTKEEQSKYALTGELKKFTFDATIFSGTNEIEVRALDVNGNAARQMLRIENKMLEATKQPTRALQNFGRLPKIWAVVVGVSDYKDKSLTLKFAASDAQSYYGFIKSPFGGSVPDEQVQLVLNQNASRADILKALNDVMRKAFEDDVVVLYIACHGMPDEVSNELYFLGYDADIKNLAGTAISKFDVEKAITKAKTKKVIVLADACHSGSFGLSPTLALRGPSSASLANRLLKAMSDAKEGLAILSASSSSEFSQEGPQWGGGHGAFTFNLLHGLKGAADKNGDGIVTVREIYEYVYRQVADDTDGKQHPDLQGQFDNNLPLSAVK